MKPMVTLEELQRFTFEVRKSVQSKTLVMYLLSFACIEQSQEESQKKSSIEFQCMDICSVRTNVWKKVLWSNEVYMSKSIWHKTNTAHHPKTHHALCETWQ
ncbi:hypothetical protein ATANTOWER_027874 [Ataeniobius toweri]|uniref:Uncharacterized protein n=1 Tax=Ataeniobius toweri TaxID=208326 RepID=A0ABU7C3U2_9TELE|nr:hypothetical protein [Ataeniobius toweri]